MHGSYSPAAARHRRPDDAFRQRGTRGSARGAGRGERTTCALRGGMPRHRSVPRSVSQLGCVVPAAAAVAEAWVRPGIALYGATPDVAHSAEHLGLRPAMRLTSELLAVRTDRGRRGCRLWIALCCRKSDADRRRRLRLCRRVSTPRARRHAGRSRRNARSDRWTRVDGSDHRRSDCGARCPRRQPGRAVGRAGSDRRRRQALRHGGVRIDVCAGAARAAL